MIGEIMVFVVLDEGLFVCGASVASMDETAVAALEVISRWGGEIKYSSGMTIRT
jgi:hypothetical protein